MPIVSEASGSTEIQRSPAKDLIAGGIGGICTVLVGHPMDTVKVRLQTMPHVYRTTWEAVSKIIIQEGPLSVYKGVSAPLISIAPLFAISYFTFGVGKQLVAEPGQKVLSDAQLFLSGMFSGMCTTIVTAPAERIKCLLQLQGTQGSMEKQTVQRYTGVWDCAVKLWKERGIRNLYVGSCATLLRDVPGSGMYFFSYERILHYLAGTSSEVTWQPLLAGGCSGIFTWIVGLPPDVMKSRVQTSPPGRFPKGVRSVFPEILKKEGITAFYQGLIPVMVRAFPANAACFLGIEMALRIFNEFLPWL